MFCVYLTLLLFSCNCEKPSYIKSIFGSPGKDEVENEYIDGIEILETGLSHPSTVSIYNKGFSSKPIEPADYPYPGHDLTGSCTWALLQEESSNIMKKYSFSNITQDQLYRHPAAAQTWYTTDEALNNADRTKIRFTLQPTYQRHFLPAFIPPGEIATIDIPESLVGSLSICLNHQTYDFSGGDTPKFKQRINQLKVQEIKLEKKSNTIGLPYGATVVFYYSGNDPVEVNVSNVILQPYFYYGMTSDEEWETDYSKRPGPYAYFDTGNLVFEVPSKFVRESTRVNDALFYWRSAIQISQTTARDVYGYQNERYGRILNPLQMKYDSFVPAGAAVAFVGGNFCHFPPDWINEVVNYESATNNPWGTIHEINHHHQSNWAKSQECGEMSNNAVSLAVFAKTNDCSSARAITGNLNGWPRYSIAAQMLNDDDTYGLSRYSTLLHMFGVEKYKKFIQSDQEGLWFSRDNYSNSGSEMLRASHVFNRDLRYHWNFHHNDDKDLNSGPCNAIDSLNEMKLKPFHPVTNYYAVGHVVDGVGFITARPFRINPHEQIIDFVSTMVQRSNKDWFGNFEFHSCAFEKGRESAWKEQSKGVYNFTPKDNLLEIEEVNVSYYDKTTKEIHVVICQFIQTNNCAKFYRVGYIPKSENNILKAYKYVATNFKESNVLTSEYRNNGIFSPDYTNNSVENWISIYEGMLTPPETGNYVFHITADPQGCFYLSEEPLKGDPDLDMDKMINYQDHTEMSFDNGNKSGVINLDASKIYYFRQIIFANSKGRGWVGYKKNDQGKVDTVPGSWIKFKNVDSESIWNNQFKPNFERIYLTDQWSGQNFKKNNNQEKWEFYKAPAGSVIINSNNGQGSGSKELSIKDALIDSDSTTEYRVNWWPSNVAVAFPHVFEIDMGQTETFKTIKIGKAGNTGWFGSNSYLQIFLAPKNFTAGSTPYNQNDYSIDHKESLIWEGFVDHTKSELFELDKEYSGRYIRLNYLNNSLAWKDGNPGRTCLSSFEVGISFHNQKVYPLTNQRYTTLTNKWDETRAGCYYNGKGFTGYAANAAPSGDNTANSIMEIKVPKYKPEIGIIGDYYPSMGKATVKIDGVEEGIIGECSLDPQVDARKLTKASRSYKSLLFYKTGLDVNKQHTVTVEVTEGSVTFAAILCHQMIVKWNTDDDRYPTILKTEFDENPVQITDWDTPTFKEDDFVPPLPSLQKSPGSKKKGLSAGAIAGIVVACVAVVSAVVVVVVMYVNKVACFKKVAVEASSP